MQAIKSVNVMSCAKMLGAIYGAMGLLAFPISLIAGFASMASGQRADTVGGVAMVAFGFFAPFLYGGLGFVVGALGAWVYNIMAKWLRGNLNLIQKTSPPPTRTNNPKGAV